MRESLKTLMRGLIDYAGLFPPSTLDMAPAARNYAAYQAGPDAWMLGRFIVPVARLDEFERHLPAGGDEPWRLGAVLGADAAADVDRMTRFNERHAGTTAVIDAIEVRAETVEDIDTIARVLPDWVDPFMEIPVREDPRELIMAVVFAGANAMVRTGGVTPDAFPNIDELARFMVACTEADVAFKATAGLHHPIRSEYALTDEPGGVRGAMHGFLNVFLAAAFALDGMGEAGIARVLDVDEAESIKFGATGMAYGDDRVDIEVLAEAREYALSFGSCSFAEPIEDLKTLDLY